MSVDAGADRGAADGHVERKRGAGLLGAIDRIVRGGRVTAELLTDSDRRGIHEVSAADLDDLVPRLGLRVERRSKSLERRNKPLSNAQRARDLHRRGESVVGTLAVVGVIVGMNGILRADRLACALTGDIGNNLVHIHVGRSARAGLKDIDRKMLHERMRHTERRRIGELGQQLVAGADHMRGLVGGEFAELSIGLGAALLENDVRFDLRLRHGAKRHGKVEHCALSGRAVERRGGHEHLAHRVGLATKVAGRGFCGRLHGRFGGRLRGRLRGRLHGRFRGRLHDGGIRLHSAAALLAGKSRI